MMLTMKLKPVTILAQDFDSTFRYTMKSMASKKVVQKLLGLSANGKYD
jgi:hypothetical protein